MKITKFNKIKGYRIFRDFTWPSTGLPDFARFNVIYGWNGAGKTSLSNIFRQIQLKKPITEGEIEILVDQTKIFGSNLDTAALPDIRTFNRDTVNRNIFELPDSQFPPVFFLGEDNVEKQKKIEELKNQHNVHLQSQSRLERKKTDADNVLENFCAEEAKGIKNLLTVAGGGPFNNYNSTNFKSIIQNLVGSTEPREQLTKELRQLYLSTKDSKAMEMLEVPSADFPDFPNLTTRTQSMLKRSVVSSVINELVENPVVATWVNEGLMLHTSENDSSKCRFCDQLLPEQRIKQLEAHFNDEFKKFQTELDLLIGEITKSKEFSAALKPPPKEALYNHLRPQYEKSVATLSQQSEAGKLYLEVLLRALNAKRNEPFKQVELLQFMTSTVASQEPTSGVENIFKVVFAGLAILSAAIGKSAFDQLVSVIEQHNKYTETFDTKVRYARTELSLDEALKALSEWKTKSETLAAATNQVASVRTEIINIKRQIEELEVETLQHRRPAKELDEEVAAYLGRDELRFEVEKNGYRITRGGHYATHLSEGERTAIAFLYFLKSLKSSDFELENGIVVIDDPVSSLDTNSLFSAFGFMKHRTAVAGQLFVLTHNFTFFRQVRNWYYNLPGQKKQDLTLRPARFYMLSSEFVEGTRTAKLEILDPFLHQYESEYHYLFKRVHEEAHKPVSQGLEAYYAMPNIARRLLEAFLAFRVPDKPGELYHKLEVVSFDPVKKTRILRFLHTYSHFDQIAEAEHDPSVLSETPIILKEILELISNCDNSHFNSMINIISPELQHNQQ